ncbi:hypothetical protein EYF80_034511 [Liparis tanakae]|uniref:Uncharacterized protein n=1 Tax=Liparis tanakae TaxID=230148 RepID=A0A4Z2GQ62_9TELE|nr:hypothetical protein EYF80_034511 [Liparis tanakae]
MSGLQCEDLWRGPRQRHWAGEIHRRLHRRNVSPLTQKGVPKKPKAEEEEEEEEEEARRSRLRSQEQGGHRHFSWSTLSSGSKSKSEEINNTAREGRVGGDAAGNVVPRATGGG